MWQAWSKARGGARSAITVLVPSSPPHRLGAPPPPRPRRARRVGCRAGGGPPSQVQQRVRPAVLVGLRPARLQEAAARVPGPRRRGLLVAVGGPARGGGRG